MANKWGLSDQDKQTIYTPIMSNSDSWTDVKNTPAGNLSFLSSSKRQKVKNDYDSKQRKKAADYNKAGSGHENILGYTTKTNTKSPTARDLSKQLTQYEKSKKSGTPSTAAATPTTETPTTETLKHVDNEDDYESSDEESEATDHGFVELFNPATGVLSLGYDDVSVGIGKGSIEPPDSPDSSVEIVEAPKKIISPKFVCKGCGNIKKDCHEVRFGPTLVQDAISFYEKTDEPGLVSGSCIDDELTKRYNDYLRFSCDRRTGLYDLKVWYSPPKCLETGSMRFAKRLVRNQQVYCVIITKRVYGAAGKHLFNIGDK